MAMITNAAEDVIKMLIAEAMDERLKRENEMLQLRTMALPDNWGRLKYVAAPTTDKTLSIPEILQFMELHARTMVKNVAEENREYNRGFHDAFRLIYEFVKKRVNEDENKNQAPNDNCC